MDILYVHSLYPVRPDFEPYGCEHFAEFIIVLVRETEARQPAACLGHHAP